MKLTIKDFKVYMPAKDFEKSNQTTATETSRPRISITAKSSQ
jgi:hypothetical protein